jgi:hypothetical protein
VAKDVAPGYEVILRVRVKFTAKGYYTANVGQRIHNKKKWLTPYQVAKRRIAALWFDDGISVVEVSELKD